MGHLFQGDFGPDPPSADRVHDAKGDEFPGIRLDDDLLIVGDSRSRALVEQDAAISLVQIDKLQRVLVAVIIDEADLIAAFEVPFGGKDEAGFAVRGMSGQG